MPRARGRRGSRREGANVTMTSVALALAAGATLYAATGASILPAVLLGLITLTPGLYLAYRGMLLRGLGAVMLLSAFAGSLSYVAYLATRGPQDPLYASLGNPLTPILLGLLGLVTGGVASYLGAVYQWAWLLEALSLEDTWMITHGLLSWSLLAYTTILSIAVLRARSIRHLGARSSFVITASTAALLIIYIAHVASQPPPGAA